MPLYPPKKRRRSNAMLRVKSPLAVEQEPPKEESPLQEPVEEVVPVQNKDNTRKYIDMGGILWVVVYFIMLSVTMQAPGKRVVWSMYPWAAFSIVWEWAAASGNLGNHTMLRRITYIVMALADTAIQVTQHINYNPIELFGLLLLFSIIIWAEPQLYKYFHYVWIFPQHWFTASLPIYRQHRSLRVALWIMTLGNACYIPTWKHAPKKWHGVVKGLAYFLPVYCAMVNLFLVHDV